jgi:xylulose-5-phosphate/fructose-6-phosphate phosphoketolase
MLRRARRSVPNAEELIRRCDTQLARHHDYVWQHLDDIPEIRDWVWTD